MRCSVGEGFLLEKIFFLSVTVLFCDRVPIRQWLSFQIGPIRGMISSHENGMGSARLGSVLTWQRSRPVPARGQQQQQEEEE